MWNLNGRARERARELEQRVSDLEADLVEMRRHHLRLAELTDLTQELLVPFASRDTDRIDAAIEAFRRSL